MDEPKESAKPDQEQPRQSKMKLQITLDTQSGQSFGRFESSKDNDSAEGLADRIFQSVSSMGKEKENSTITKISEAIRLDDHRKAAKIILSDDVNSSLVFFDGKNIFEVALKIDRTRLSLDESFALLKTIALLAYKTDDYTLVYKEFRELLTHPHLIDDAQKHSITNIFGLVELRRGAPETALKIWHGLLANSNNLHASERGWVHRNIAIMYRNKADPISENKAHTSFQHAIDAFLQAGNRMDTISTFGHLSALLEKTSTAEAIDQFDNMLARMEPGKNPLEDEITADIYHRKSRKLFDACRYIDAKLAALEAVTLRRGLHGAEVSLISSLHLAALAASSHGDTQGEKACTEEAHDLEMKTGSSHFKHARRVEELFNTL